MQFHAICQSLNPPPSPSTISLPCVCCLTMVSFDILSHFYFYKNCFLFCRRLFTTTPYLVKLNDNKKYGKIEKMQMQTPAHTHIETLRMQISSRNSGKPQKEAILQIQNGRNKSHFWYFYKYNRIDHKPKPETHSATAPSCGNLSRKFGQGNKNRRQTNRQSSAWLGNWNGKLFFPRKCLPEKEIK